MNSLNWFSSIDPEVIYGQDPDTEIIVGVIAKMYDDSLEYGCWFWALTSSGGKAEDGFYERKDAIKAFEEFYSEWRK